MAAWEYAVFLMPCRMCEFGFEKEAKWIYQLLVKFNKLSSLKS